MKLISQFQFILDHSVQKHDSKFILKKLENKSNLLTQKNKKKQKTAKVASQLKANILNWG